MNKMLIALLCLSFFSHEVTVTSEDKSNKPSLSSAIMSTILSILGPYAQDWIDKMFKVWNIPLSEQAKLALKQREIVDLHHKQLQQSLANDDEYAPVEEKKTFADYINVPEDAKNFVSRIKEAEKYKNLPLPSGALLIGDPGAGKTLLARAIAGELDCPFFAYAGTDFIPKKFIGSGSDAVNKVFSKARKIAEAREKNIAIIFIDEFDVIGSRGDTEGSDVNTESINALLAQLDGFTQDKVKVIVIAATNYPDKIDSALTRPGRIDKVIHITYPDESARKKFINIFLRKSFISDELKNDIDVVIEGLAKITQGLSPAEIQRVVNDAAEITITRGRGLSGINKDSLARALWILKQGLNDSKLPGKEVKRRLLDVKLASLGLKARSDDLIPLVKDMTLTEIEELFSKAQTFAIRDSSRSLYEWLMVAINAQNQLIQMNKNREVINICKNIYAPMVIQEYNYPKKIAEFSPEQKERLLRLQPEDIFKKFENENIINLVRLNIKAAEKSYSESNKPEAKELSEKQKENLSSIERITENMSSAKLDQESNADEKNLSEEQKKALRILPSKSTVPSLEFNSNILKLDQGSDVIKE
jgi:AAA+ superfamily predicted ATPase